MKSSLTYGFIITLASSILLMIQHVAGFTTDPEKFGKGLVIGIISGLTVTTIGVILGMRAKRAEQGIQSFSYGKALKSGICIVLFASIFGTIFNSVYFKYINPNYTETTIAWTKNFMEGMGARDRDIEKAEEKIRADASLSKQLIKGAVGAVVFGTLISLVCAAFVRRRPAEDTPITS